MERTTTETIFAIIVGIVLGTIVAISIWFVKTGRVNFNFAVPLTKTVTTPTPKNSQPVPFTLLISQPNDGMVVKEQKITVTGKTAGSGRVLVSQNSQDTVVLADKDGLFKASITLDEGDNEIIVTSFSAIGETKQQSLTVVYKK